MSDPDRIPEDAKAKATQVDRILEESCIPLEQGDDRRVVIIVAPFLRERPERIPTDE